MRWVPLFLIAACGDNLHFAPDAATPDTAPPPPDAAVCDLDVSEDEANCGACDHLCHGGEVCKDASCECPGGVVPPFVFPTGFEQFFGLGGFQLVLAPTLGLGSINGLIFGYDTGLPLDTDIDLATVPLGSTPFVASAVGLDIETMALDASYFATSGTIKFTKRCETEIEGTLRNATFNGVTGGLLGGGIPMPDPDGCVVQVTTLSFHLATAPCEQP